MAYKYLTVDVLADGDVVQRCLNEHSEQGWRLTTTTPTVINKIDRFAGVVMNQTVEHRMLLIFEKLVRAPRKKKVVD